MSILVENNEIHLIGNVNDGCIDEYVIIPFITVFSMIEEMKPDIINLHLSVRDNLCDINHIIDTIKYSKIPVNIYIQNSELFRGYKGVDGQLIDALSLAKEVFDYRDRDYTPPFHAALPEIQMMREYDMYKYDNEEDEYDEEDDEKHP